MKVKAVTRSSKDGTLPPHWHGYLEERFPGHFAQIGTINTLRLKNAVRDVARAIMGSVPPDIEDLCKGFLVPPQGVTDQNFIFGYHTDEGEVPGSIETDVNLQKYIDKYPDQWEIVKESLSLWRSRGRHASAYVISNEPIDGFIPTTNVGGIKALSFAGPECEAVGAIKMDFLVVNSIKDIQEALKLVQQRTLGYTPKDQYINGVLVPGTRIVPDKDGNLWDIWGLPQVQEVFSDLYEKKTETVFQFDTNSARQWLEYFNGIVHSISDMAVFTSLDRPGPLDCYISSPENPALKHNMLVEYARRAKGYAGSPDIVKEFDSLCSETKGVMIYQETLTRVYQYFTGCDASEAEEFRGNVGKKKKEKIEKAYSLFMERAKQKVDEKSAQAVWDSLITFAKYGFNASHAKSYATTSYACLWLKHYYPLEWWCAVLRNASKEEINDKFWPYCGHLVLFPDITLSKANWEIEGDKIRAPISMLYGIGETAHKQLLEGGPYTDLKSFCESIVNYQKSRTTQKERISKKDGKTELVNVWGRNALDIGKIYNMICAGSMSSFFDKDLSISECVELYHSTMKEIYAKEGKKYAKSKKQLPTLDALGRYQALKAVLPPCGGDLLKIVLESGVAQDGEVLKVDTKNEKLFAKAFTYSKLERREVETNSPVVSGARLRKFELTEGFVEKGAIFGMIVYVEDVESINYGPGKSKLAKKFFVEAEGYKWQLVWWPDFRSGVLSNKATSISKGSIIVVVIEKRAGRKDLSIKDVGIIRTPLGGEDETQEQNSLDTQG